METDTDIFNLDEEKMIILITGASHTGKTLLAQKMLEKYKYPYLSIDHLKMGLIRSGNTELTPEDDEALTGYLWPIIREIVKTAIENKQNLIIEGCYIPFDWRRDFEERYLSSIRFICLAMSENYIENHFGEIIGYESEIEARMIDADCTKDSLKADNRDIINGFQHAGEQVVLIYSDYEQTIKGLLDRQTVFMRTIMKTVLCENTEWLLSEEAFSIYASCMYHPTYEEYKAQMEDYLHDSSVKVFVCENRGKRIGMMVLKSSGVAAEIIGIAVSDNARHKGIGKELIQSVIKSEEIERIKAQTDDGSIGFYRKCGFSKEKTVVEYSDGSAVRYNCVLYK